MGMLTRVEKTPRGVGRTYFRSGESLRRGTRKECAGENRDASYQEIIVIEKELTRGKSWSPDYLSLRENNRDSLKTGSDRTRRMMIIRNPRYHVSIEDCRRACTELNHAAAVRNVPKITAERM